jgi:hypothetical protein
LPTGELTRLCTGLSAAACAAFPDCRYGAAGCAAVAPARTPRLI